jgi:hypothetical protein
MPVTRMTRKEFDREMAVLEDNPLSRYNRKFPNDPIPMMHWHHGYDDNLLRMMQAAIDRGRAITGRELDKAQGYNPDDVGDRTVDPPRQAAPNPAAKAPPVPEARPPARDIDPKTPAHANPANLHAQPARSPGGIPAPAIDHRGRHHPDPDEPHNGCSKNL